MRYGFLICAAIIVMAHIARGQGLTQSADGKSTIPLKGSAIGIDIAQAELSFGYNNLNTVVQTQRITPFYGVSVKVKNEEGVGDLFNAGDLVPSGSGNIYAGLSFSNAFNNSALAHAAYIAKKQQRFTNWEKGFRTKLKVRLEQYITLVCAESGLAASDIDPVKEELLKRLEKQKNIEEYADTIGGLTAPDTVKPVIEAVKTYAKTESEIYIKKKQYLIDERKAVYQLFKTSSYQRFTIYGFTGISSTSFKKFNQVDVSNFSNSFKTINDRGDEIGLGLNYQVNNIWFGISYSYALTNNFGDLVKKDYTIKSTSTNASQEFTQEKKITAYAGDYGQLHVNNLNADIVFRVKLDKEYKNSVLINPYLRGTVFSRNTDLMVNKTNIGTGFYFMEKKFLGGFYVELPDINNNVEKQKPEADQNLRKPLKRITFGIVTKFNLASIANW